MGTSPRTSPPIPANVRAVFNGYDTKPRQFLLSVRELIYETAVNTDGVGKMTETLKWNEPAYLTHAPKSGTTIRLGWKAKFPESARLYVNCQTSLVEDWRARYTGTLRFDGNRAVLLDINKPLLRGPLAHCIAMALTYHSRKKTP